MPNISKPFVFYKTALLQQARAHYLSIQHPRHELLALRDWLPILQQKREIPILKFQHTRTRPIPHELHSRLLHKPPICGIEVMYAREKYTIVAIDAEIDIEEKVGKSLLIDVESFIRFVALTPSVHIIH